MEGKEMVNVDDLHLIQEIIPNLSSDLELDTILTMINNSAGGLVSAEGASVMLFDDEKQHLYFIAASGGDPGEGLRRITVTEGVAWDVAQSGEADIVNDTASDPRFIGSVDKVTDFKTKTILCVPIILNDEILGVLEAVNKTAGAKFTEADKQLFSTLADQIAIVINNARVAEE